MHAKRIWYWEQFAHRCAPAIHQIVGFVKKIPGFSNLCQDDQLIIVKQGFFSGFCCQLAQLTADNNLTFEDAHYIRPSFLTLMFDVS